MPCVAGTPTGKVSLVEKDNATLAKDCRKITGVLTGKQELPFTLHSPSYGRYAGIFLYTDPT